MPSATQSEKSRSSILKSSSLNIVKHEDFTLAIILVIICVVLSVITHGLFADRTNILNILLQSSMLGVVAVGQAFVILTAGIDLSVGGIGILSGVMGASLLSAEAGTLGGGAVPISLGILVMLMIGAGMGAINGVLVSRLRLPALIATLAIWQVAKGSAYQLTLAQIIRELPERLAPIAHGSIGGVPIPVLIFIAAIAVGYFVLNHTSFGKSIYAVGGNIVTAWFSGIKTKNTLFWVYVVSGTCAGIASIIQLSRIMVGTFGMFSSLELDSIAAVVIGGVSLFGGKGSIIGVLIGVLILGVINNGMNLMGLNQFMQNVIKGLVIFAAVAIDAWRRGGK